MMLFERKSRQLHTTYPKSWEKNTYNLRNQNSASTGTGLTTHVPGDKYVDALVPVGAWQSYFCSPTYYIWPNQTKCIFCSDHSFCIRIRPKRNSQERGGGIVSEVNHITWLRCFVMITIIRCGDAVYFLSKLTPLVIKGCNMKCTHISAAQLVYILVCFKVVQTKSRRDLSLTWKHLKNLNTTLEGMWDAAIYKIYMSFSCTPNNPRKTAIVRP